MHPPTHHALTITYRTHRLTLNRNASRSTNATARFCTLWCFCVALPVPLLPSSTQVSTWPWYHLSVPQFWIGSSTPVSARRYVATTTRLKAWEVWQHIGIASMVCCWKGSPRIGQGLIWNVSSRCALCGRKLLCDVFNKCHHLSHLVWCSHQLYSAMEQSSLKSVTYLVSTGEAIIMEENRSWFATYSRKDDQEKEEKETTVQTVTTDSKK